MRAVVDSVQCVVPGSVTASAVTATDLLIEVVDGSDFPEPREGETLFVLIGGIAVPYSERLDADDYDSGVTVDTLVIPSPGAPADVTVNTRVDVPGRVRYEALVYLGDELTPSKAVIHHKLVNTHALRVAEGGLGTDVEMEPIDGPIKWLIVNITDQEPATNLSMASADPIPAVTLRATFTEHAADLAGAVPAPTLGDGQSNADIEFVGRLKSNAFETTARGTIARLTSGAGALFVAPDGATALKGAQGDFDTLAARQTLLGGETTGAAGGTFTLQDTGLLDPPSQPPTVDYNWLTATILLPASLQPLLGLGAKDATAAFSMGGAGRRVVRFNPTSGAYTAAPKLAPGPTETTTASACYSTLADCYQLLEYDAVAGEWLVRYYDWTTLAFDHEWVVTALGSAQSPRPAIASFTDSGHEYTKIFRSNATDPATPGTINIWRFDNEVPAGTPLSVTADSFPFYDIGALAVFGGAALVTGLTNLIADGVMAGGVYEGQPVIPVIDMGYPSSGLAFGDTLGYLLVENGDLRAAGMGSIDTDTTHRTWYLSAGSPLIAQQSAFDEAGLYWVAGSYTVPGTGPPVLETAFSAANATLQVKVPGANVTYTYGAPPAGSAANGTRTYLARDTGAGVPPRTDFHLEGTSNTGEWHNDVFSVLGTGSPPPATGTIPSGDPFAIVVGGVAQIRGDGTGHIYDLIAAGGGGGGSGGGISIHCGGSAAAGVSIHCGGSS